MKRKVLGVVAGLVVFVVVATIAGLIMRAAWADYARVAEAMTFTLPMMIARLSIGAIATIAAGWTTAVIVRQSRLARLMPGLVLLLLFVPQHVRLWNAFPAWYHLTFLISIVPLIHLGGTLSLALDRVEVGT